MNQIAVTTDLHESSEQVQFADWWARVVAYCIDGAMIGDKLHVWWGGPSESEAEVALRPIPREAVRMEWPV